MPNILICDDERDIVTALKIYLSAEGYGLYEAYTGREALDIVRKHTIHLILMDIMMPEMDGISATAKLREEYNIPIILLTAKSEDTDKVLGLNVGADDYITKPFNPIEVLARVRSQLRRYTTLGGMEQKPSKLVIGSITLDDEAKTSPPSSTTSCTFLCAIRAGSTPPPRSMSRSGTRPPMAPRARWPSTSGTSGRSWRSLPPIPGI